MMAAYPLFVYPQQSEFEKMNFAGINTSKFEDISGISARSKYKNNLGEYNKKFCMRIRNSLAHAKFIIEKESSKIIFMDDDKGRKFFEARISFTDFGDFISDFYIEAKKQYFEPRV
jgi:hypothetical protein